MFGPGIDGFGWGHGIASFFGAAIGFFVSLLFLAIFIGLVILLVRFLLIGTRAAQLYVAQHEPPKPAAPATAPSAPRSPAPANPAPATTAPAATPAATKPAPTTAAPAKPAAAPTAATPTKPATKPRTPKTPPSTDL